LNLEQVWNRIQNACRLAAAAKFGGATKKVAVKSALRDGLL
jgi:hypothetical protein